MFRSVADADRIAGQYTETAIAIARDFTTVADYDRSVHERDAEIRALPISRATQDALISQNAVIDRQVRSILR